MALDWWLRGRAEVPAPPAAHAISGLAAAIAVIAWRQGTRLTPAPTPPRIQPARES
jgi:hypothetical protein